MRAIASLILVLTFTTALPATSLASDVTRRAAERPAVGLVAGVLWAYKPATHEGAPLRYAMGVPLVFKAGTTKIALELGASSAFTAFDLSPYALAGINGPAGHIRLGGNVAYSYTPPWNGVGYGSHLVATSGVLVVPLVPGRLALLASLGPRYVIGAPAPVIGGGVLFAITPSS